MRKPGKGTGLARGLVIAAAIVMLAGCGSDKKAAGSAVEMRDMDVVDGTANDSMTDLDAVRSDGVGVGSNSGNQVAPTEKAKSAKADAAGTESEDVPAE